MMEFNKEQIVKALECCSINQACDGCPMFDREPVSDCNYYVMSYALALIRELTEEVAKAKADTVRDMQERLEERINQTIQVFDFQISECNAVRQALRGVKNDIHQIAKEML